MHEIHEGFQFALGNVSVDTYGGDGTWRSLVARTLGVGEVPSSNLGVPTKNSRQEQAAETPRDNTKGFQSSQIESLFASVPPAPAFYVLGVFGFDSSRARSSRSSDATCLNAFRSSAVPARAGCSAVSGASASEASFETIFSFPPARSSLESLFFAPAIVY